MTKGESDVEDDVAVVVVAVVMAAGGGIGKTEMSCMERVSRIGTVLPAAYASRPVDMRSAAPPLLRDGGPGNMQSDESTCGNRINDIVVIV